jgi:DNA-binding transcriptional LysR family regulator
MEIRQLKYFLAVAERMHFTSAAAALHVSQPALSQQIRMLEEEIGVKLLERTNRRVQLTPAGAAFRIRAQAALRETVEAASDARQVERGEGGNISIGFVTTAAVMILPKLLELFCSRYPDAGVSLHELDPRAQLEALEEKRIAVGFTSVPSSLPSLECRCLTREPLIVALPQKHPAARRRTLDLKHLSEERFLLPPRGLLHGIHEEIMQACHRAGFVPKHILPIRLAETAVCLVAGNLGIALIPESLRRLRVRGVVYRALSHDISYINLYAIRSKALESPLVKNFWNCVEEVSQ